MESEKLMPCKKCGGEPFVQTEEFSGLDSLRLYAKCIGCGEHESIPLSRGTSVNEYMRARVRLIEKWNGRNADDHK